MDFHIRKKAGNILNFVDAIYKKQTDVHALIKNILRNGGLIKITYYKEKNSLRNYKSKRTVVYFSV